MLLSIALAVVYSHLLDILSITRNLVTTSARKKHSFIMDPPSRVSGRSL